MRVRCITNQSAPRDDAEFGSVQTTHELTPGEAYEVLGIEAGHYRLLNDSGEPLLFESVLFEVVDPERPAHWVATVEDGAEYAYAPELGAPGFFEDYHDRKPDAVRVFHRYINRHLHIADAA